MENEQVRGWLAAQRRNIHAVLPISKEMILALAACIYEHFMFPSSLFTGHNQVADPAFD